MLFPLEMVVAELGSFLADQSEETVAMPVRTRYFGFFRHGLALALPAFSNLVPCSFLGLFELGNRRQVEVCLLARLVALAVPVVLMSHDRLPLAGAEQPSHRIVKSWIPGLIGIVEKRIMIGAHFRPVDRDLLILWRRQQSAKIGHECLKRRIRHFCSAYLTLLDG